MDVRELFAEHQYKKTALYGLSVETEKALKALGQDFDIVGLLDGFQEAGSLYGKNILSFEQAVHQGVGLIIVVARPGSCRAIAKRIGDRCRENGIALLDIRGKDLLETVQAVYDFSGIAGVTKAELRTGIQKADVVSFDLFDTLVMRQTLYAEDIIYYVDCRLRENGIYIEDFCRRRLESEKRLSRHTAPGLADIYEDMLDRAYSDETCSITAKQLAELEWETDFKFMIPRKAVCDIFRETAASGKTVYIVSDTYYTKKQLAEILEKCNLLTYTDIFASSEYGTGKTQKLYAILKNREYGKSFLHIGDDPVADAEHAQKLGLETVRLLSGADLFEAVGYLGFSGSLDSLSEHLRAGLFTARIFNSPFQFEQAGRRVEFTDVYDIGYLVCAPVICDFMFWFQEQVQKQQLKNVWFCARDGYLVQKLYACMMEYCGQEDKSVYFLTSRIAAIRAGVQDEEDIRYVDEMKFSGSLEQNLKERFGIDAANLSEIHISGREQGLLKYQSVILDNARRLGRNYKKYVDKLDVREGDIAFFDFVAKGTSQMYVQRLTDHHLKGFYFLQLEPQHMKEKGMDIRSFYAEEKEGADTDGIFENYYILETMLTAPHPSVQGFDESGRPVYERETRTERDIRCFERAQEGILDYFRIYMELCPKSEWTVINRKMDDLFLNLIHRVKVADADFLKLVVEDPFFNRMTDITDVI